MLTTVSFAQTTGDIAVIGFNADGNDDLAIVALVDIPANTTIYIADNELDGAGGFVDTNEGELTWDTGSNIITAGTVVTLNDLANGTGATISNGTITAGSSFNLSSSGDAAFFYLGTDENTPTTFLAGIQNEDNNFGDLIGSGLTEGTTFVTFTTSGNPDGGVYSGPRNSETTFSDYLVLIGNPANWTTEDSDGTLVLPFDTTPFVESATATPIITLGTDVSGLDYFEGNGPSVEGTFNVAGTNLTADIILNTASSDFEISTTTGTGFTNSLTLTQTGGSVTTTIYVRLAAGLTSNSYAEAITATSTGATSETINVSGVVTPSTPQFSVFGTPDPLNYSDGNGPSNEDSIFVEGLFLTNDITVSAPTNFEVSLTSGSGFTSSVSLPQVSGTVANTEVFVRLTSGLPVGPYSGDITISSSSATDQTVAISGNVFGAATNALVLTGVFDGPVNSNPKGVEITALANIADLSLFGIGSANNGGGTDGQEFTFPSVALTAGDVIYVASESTDFTSFFGFAPDYTTGAMGINGDDAVELFENGVVIDTFGDINTIGDGEPWDYTDGWAYRVDNTGPDGGFVLANWTFSGIDQLEGGTTNATTTVPYPIATYTNNALSVDTFNKANFNIYPNPTNTGFVNITTKANTAVNVTVYDVLGKQVLNKTLNNNTLDVTSLTTGVYILKLNQNGTSTTKRLVVE